MTLNSFVSSILLARTAKDSTSFDPSMLYLILAIVSLFVVVSLLLFLRKRMIPLFRLWYITARYGKYSFEFLEFFKENDLRNPHNNCIKDEITLRFLPFFKPSRNGVNYKTITPIEFGTIPFLMLYNELMKAKGIPDCINVAKFNDSRVKVIGYNEALQGMKMKSLFYFIDERFMMGEYVFTDLIKVKPAKITGILSAKYLEGKEVTADTVYISDQKANILYFENNGFSICLRYFFSGDHKINEILASVYSIGGDSAENYIRALQNEELLNRF
jgi:hypothetical protein